MALAQPTEYESISSDSQSTSAADSLQNLTGGGESQLDDEFDCEKSVAQSEDEGDRELSWLTALQRTVEPEQDTTSLCSCVDEDAGEKSVKANNNDQRTAGIDEPNTVKYLDEQIEAGASNKVAVEKCVKDGMEISVAEVCDPSVFETLTKRQTTALLKRVATLNATIRKRTAQRGAVIIQPSSETNTHVDESRLVSATATPTNARPRPARNEVDKESTILHSDTSVSEENVSILSNKQLIADLTESTHHHTNLAERFGRILLPHGKYAVSSNVNDQRDSAPQKKIGSVNQSMDDGDQEVGFESDFVALPDAVDDRGAPLFGIAAHIHGGLTLVDDLVRADSIRNGPDGESGEKRPGQTGSANSKASKSSWKTNAVTRVSADLVELHRLALLDATASFDQFSVECFVSLPAASSHIPSHATSGSTSHSAFSALFQKRAAANSQKVLFGCALNASNVAFCEHLVTWLRDASRLDTVGLFRISASAARVRTLTEELEREATNGCFSTSNTTQAGHTGIQWLTEFAERRELTPHEAGTLLKRFVRAVPHSVFTRELHDAFCACGSLPDRDAVRIGTLNELFLLLPAANRRVLNATLCLLHDTARRADRNRMPIANLALVFAPTFFSLSAANVCVADPSAVEPNAALVVSALIHYHAALNVVPSHLLGQLRRVNERKREQQAKQAVARCRLDRVSRRPDAALLPKAPTVGSSAQIRVQLVNSTCIAQITPQTTVCEVLTQLGTRITIFPSRRDAINDDLVEQNGTVTCCRHVLTTSTGEPGSNQTSRRASSNQTPSIAAQHSCAHALTRASSALFTPLSLSIAKPNAASSAKRNGALWLYEVGGNLLDARRLDPEACVWETYIDNINAEWLAG